MIGELFLIWLWVIQYLYIKDHFNTHSMCKNLRETALLVPSLEKGFADKKVKDYKELITKKNELLHKTLDQLHAAHPPRLDPVSAASIGSSLSLSFSLSFFLSLSLSLSLSLF